MRKIIKKILSLFLVIGLVSCINNFSFAQPPGRIAMPRFPLAPSLPGKFIGPYKEPKPVKHHTWQVDKTRICSISKSWIQLGVGVAGAAGFASGGTLAKKVVPVMLGKKGKEALAGEIIRAFSNIKGIEKAAHMAVAGLNVTAYIAAQIDELNKHGVKFTFYVVNSRLVECYCPKGKDHDMFAYEPVIKIECTTY